MGQIVSIAGSRAHVSRAAIAPQVVRVDQARGEPASAVQVAAYPADGLAQNRHAATDAPASSSARTIVLEDIESGTATVIEARGVVSAIESPCAQLVRVGAQLVRYGCDGSVELLVERTASGWLLRVDPVKGVQL